MTTHPTTEVTQREPELTGQTVVVIGGSSGIGLETARRDRTEGAGVILTGLLGDAIEKRRAELRARLPIGRVIEPADVAALAVHIMTNTALTGGTYTIDGGEQLV
jgi:NAD(P)-dependent dehydrogenase (short-subunit alcohol dehydrogenase family)